jgi:hypothetical protein
MSGPVKLTDTLPEATRARLVRAYKQGVYLEGLQERFGISRKQVNEILRNAGIEPDHGGH